MDKDRELYVLSKFLKLFKPDRKEEIIVSERPDFLIDNGNETLGVEITELYINETMARINNKEGYLELLLEGKVKMASHVNVNVSKITFRNETETYSCKGLLTEFNEESFTNNLLTLIQRKESKCPYYLQNCKECCLVIHFDEMIDTYLSGLNRFIENHQILLKSSSFSEIILLTRNYQRKDVYFYLKTKKRS